MRKSDLEKLKWRAFWTIFGARTKGLGKELAQESAEGGEVGVRELRASRGELNAVFFMAFARIF